MNQYDVFETIAGHTIQVAGPLPYQAAQSVAYSYALANLLAPAEERPSYTVQPVKEQTT